MNKNMQKLTLSAMFMAVGMVLPFLTGQIPKIGGMLLPMHIPVLLCGLICGWKYGTAMGFVLPLFRSLVLGSPTLFPRAAAMAFELAAYGAVAGVLYERSKRKCIASLYFSLISAMLSGRIVWGAAQTLFLGISGSSFTWEMFTAGALFNAVPGIIAQLVLIPAVMIVLDRTGYVKFNGTNAEKAVDYE
ncbi:MAG: ECF transporter S component [Oscillospiraceae bacterium]